MPQRIPKRPSRVGEMANERSPARPFEEVEEFERRFREQIGGFSRQAKERAMDTFNGAIAKGAPVGDAIRMAIGSAKAFDGGQGTGRSPALRQ